MDVDTEVLQDLIQTFTHKLTNGNDRFFATFLFIMHNNLPYRGKGEADILNGGGQAGCNFSQEGFASHLPPEKIKSPA